VFGWKHFPMKPPCPWSYSSPASHFDNTSLMSGSFDKPYGGSVTTESTLLSSNRFSSVKQSPCNSNSFVLFSLIKSSPFRLIRLISASVPTQTHYARNARLPLSAHIQGALIVIPR